MVAVWTSFQSCRLLQPQFLITLIYQTFGNIVGKGENDGIYHFPFSYNVFNSFKDKFYFIERIYCVVCKWLQFGLVSNLVVYYNLNF